MTAVLAHLENGAEAHLLALQPAGGPDVADLIAADPSALPRSQADIADVLEARGGRDPDEEDRNADMDQVAAIASAVAADERREGDHGRLAGHRASGACA